MSSKCVLLEVPVKEIRETDEKRVTYVFHKDVHENLLLQNLDKMQANGALMTDVTLCSTARDHEEPFHSMLLAACSPVLKQRLTGEYFNCIGGKIIPKEIKMTAEMLVSLREFLYTSVPMLNAENVDGLQQFADRYSIEDLARMCERFRDRPENDDPQVLFDDHQDILPRLFDMFQSKELTTTIFEDSEGQTQFSVHGPLFAAASPVLLELLQPDNLFSQEVMKYRLNHTRSAVLQDFIKYVYLAEITLNYENVEDLLRTACRYQIPALALACCDYLQSIMDAENVVGILWLAKELDWTYTNELEEETKIFIVENFEDVAQSQEFVNLGFKDLIDIINNDSLNVQSEEAVYHAIIEWVSAAEEARQSHLYSLLQYVRLEFTSAEFLEEISKDSRIQKCSQCRKLICKHQERSLPVAEDMPGHNKLFEDFQIAPSQLQIEDFEPGTTSERATLNEDADYVKPQGRRRRKNGEPDMRYKENRNGLLRKDGRPDMRFSENKKRYNKVKSQAERPQTKQGKPDMRFKVNKETFGSVSQRGSNTSGNTKDEVKTLAETRKTKQGKPDMRFKVNKERFGSVSQKGSNTSGNTKDKVKTLAETRKTKQGKPDMRFKVNKEKFGSSSQNVSNTSGNTNEVEIPRETPLTGPQKKDGTLDMRYAVNKAASKSGTHGGTRIRLGSPSTPTMSRSQLVWWSEWPA